MAADRELGRWRSGFSPYSIEDGILDSEVTRPLASGSGLDLLWILCGLCLDYLWIIFGSSLDYLWILFGLSLDPLWIIFGSSLDYLWVTFGSAFHQFLFLNLNAINLQAVNSHIADSAALHGVLSALRSD